MKFDYLIKICELEIMGKSKEHGKFANIILKELDTYIVKKKKSNPELSTNVILEDVKQLIYNYLNEITGIHLYENVISYYTNKKIYSYDVYLRGIYDKVNRMDQTKEIDIINEPDLFFTTNIDKNLENLFRSFMKEIRLEKKTLNEVKGFREVYKEYTKSNSKKFIKRVQKNVSNIYPDKKYTAEQIKKTFQLFSKSEYELVEERIKLFTELQGKELKTNLTKGIIESVKLLDALGLMKHYVKLNNKSYKKIYINDIDYKYEEVMELLLSEEKLKKQSTEGLILMSAFWINRVNKVIKDLSKAVYILQNEELQDKNNKVFKAGVTEEVNYNLELKMLFLHKVFFELFQKVQKSVYEKKEMDLSNEIDKIYKKIGKEYNEYFSKLFPNSKNLLKEDMYLVGVFENIRYNSYQFKDIAIESVIVCLANNQFNGIENFGYIDENNGKKEALIAVDLKGYNMYFALHCNKNDLREFWKETTGNAEFPIYKGAKDFVVSDDNEILKAQIFVPLTKDASNKFENALKTITPKDRYANSIKHLAYLTKNGKMPEHMQQLVTTKGRKKYQFVREYINLDEDEGFNIGIKKKNNKENNNKDCFEK